MKAISTPSVVRRDSGGNCVVNNCVYNSCFLLFAASGKLYVFGSNSEGQLGFEDVKNCLTPTELHLGVDVTFADCGYYHTAAIGGECGVLL